MENKAVVGVRPIEAQADLAEPRVLRGLAHSSVQGDSPLYRRKQAAWL